MRLQSGRRHRERPRSDGGGHAPHRSRPTPSSTGSRRRPTFTSEGAGVLAIASGDAAADRTVDNERVRGFSRRWFRFVVGMYTSCNRPGDAARFTHLGLLASPEDPAPLRRPRHPLEIRMLTFVPNPATLRSWRAGARDRGRPETGRRRQLPPCAVCRSATTLRRTCISAGCGCCSRTSEPGPISTRRWRRHQRHGPLSRASLSRRHRGTRASPAGCAPRIRNGAIARRRLPDALCGA